MTDWIAQAQKVALGGDLNLRGAAKSVIDMAASGGLNAGYWLDPNNAIPQAMSLRGAVQIAEAGLKTSPSYAKEKDSIFSLSVPRDHALTNPLRDYLWSFWIREEFGSQDFRNVFKRVNKVNLPGVEFDVIEKVFANQRFSMAGIKSIGKINLTIYEDAEGVEKTLEYLYKWHAKIQDPKTGGINPPYGDKGYKKTAIIAVYRLLTGAGDASDMTAMWMEVHGVWPSSIADIQLDYAGNGLFTIEATLTADQIGRVWFAGPQKKTVQPKPGITAPWSTLVGEAGHAAQAIRSLWHRPGAENDHPLLPEIPGNLVSSEINKDQMALAGEEAADRRANSQGTRIDLSSPPMS